jgi:hypothetical protein
VMTEYYWRHGDLLTLAIHRRRSGSTSPNRWCGRSRSSAIPV